MSGIAGPQPTRNNMNQSDISKAAAALGRLGGLTKTPARAAASAANGKLGGRPRGENYNPRKRTKKAG